MLGNMDTCLETTLLSGGTVGPGVLLQKLFKLPNLGGSNNQTIEMYRKYDGFPLVHCLDW